MTSTIHPTALVDSSASIGEGCVIGPYSIVGPGVCLGRANILHPHSVLEGQLWVGNGNTFHPFSRIGGLPQLAEGEPTGRLVIGDANIFRENVTVQPSCDPVRATIIGNRSNFLSGSHVGHDSQIGDDVVVSNGVAIAGHVQIGDQAYISGLVGVHQWVSLGRLCFVAAGSMVDKSILPYCLAQGDRARVRGYNRVGIDRSGAGDEFKSEVKQAVRAYIFGRLSRAEISNANSATSSVIGEWSRFARATRRGLASPVRQSR